jgi:hypothetical protein
MDRVIYVVDVGSPKGGLAWARLTEDPAQLPSGSDDFARAPKRIAADILLGTSVAVGFEAPAFVPVPASVQDLAKARIGEVRGGSSRPWCVGAGAYVTTMVLQIAAWLMREIRTELGPAVGPTLTLVPGDWEPAGMVLLWEAFVSGPGHARSTNAHGMSEHVQDAATAALAFREWLSTSPRPATAVRANPRFCTLGAVALWAGWATDLGVLSQEPLVLWPDRPLGAGVLPDVGAPNPLTPSPAATAASATIGGTLTLVCGDSHSFWKSHQQTAQEIANFVHLVQLVASSSPRPVQASFDGGTTWLSLRLNSPGPNQLSWKKHNSGGSKNAKLSTMVRP